MSDPITVATAALDNDCDCGASEKRPHERGCAALCRAQRVIDALRTAGMLSPVPDPVVVTNLINTLLASRRTCPCRSLTYDDNLPWGHHWTCAAQPALRPRQIPIPASTNGRWIDMRGTMWIDAGNSQVHPEGGNATAEISWVHNNFGPLRSTS